VEQRQGSMESLVSRADFYRDKRVLVTGHTGFKGAWLCLWLAQMGCRVTGYALPPQETPDSLYSLLHLGDVIDSHYGDIRDMEALRPVVSAAKPDMVFHLAAQALVLPSYETPLDTFSTNIMGTLNLLECTRHTGTVRAIVNVTSDKCYENSGPPHAFSENDPLGGYDPYSSSKAAVEIVSAAYRRSFLHEAGIHMATARAGNVIGGGDFAPHRLIPDIVRAAQSGVAVELRHPQSTRPWQYVLDVLRGYLILGQALHEKGASVAQAFNFGPDEANIQVGTVAKRLIAATGNRTSITQAQAPSPHEALLLQLDNSKAKSLLGWYPRIPAHRAIELAGAWYYTYTTQRGGITAFSKNQLSAYEHEIA